MNKKTSRFIAAILTATSIVISGCGGGGGASVDVAADCGYSDQITIQDRMTANMDSQCYTQVDLADTFLSSARISCVVKNYTAGDAAYQRYTTQAKSANSVTASVCAPLVTPGVYYLLGYVESSGNVTTTICTTDGSFKFPKTGGQTQVLSSNLSPASCTIQRVALTK